MATLPQTSRARYRARTTVDPARQVAFNTLRAVALNDAYANLVLPPALRQAGLSGRDAAFATELTYGTLRGMLTYDTIIAAVSGRATDQIDPPVLDIVRLGAHQLLAMRVPAHAAVATMVDLARQELTAGPVGFVNAVLRRIAERPLSEHLGRLAGPDSGRSLDDQLAIRTSHPTWIVRAYRDAMRARGLVNGATDVHAALAANNEPPVVTLVALPGLLDVTELVDHVHVATDAHSSVGTQLSPYAVSVTGDPSRLEAVRAGRARVQDTGSQFVSLLLAQVPLVGPDTGQWLDLCAGPGGKSALLGALLEQRRSSGEVPASAQLVANEPLPHRAELVRASVAAVPGVRVLVNDGRDIGQVLMPGTYDRVLVDAPCTGLGALRRRPESRWRRKPSDVPSLRTLQGELLRSGLQMVRPGGVVAYVTCSPHVAETHTVVSDELAEHPEFELLEAGQMAGNLADVTANHQPYLQLWPHLHGTDAMFLALIRRSL